MVSCWDLAAEETLQRCCAAFVAAMEVFSASFPEIFVTAEKGAIEKAFRSKHGDAELLTMLEETVAPPDISRIGIFRGAIAKHAKEARAGDMLSGKIAGRPKQRRSRQTSRSRK